MINVPLTRGSAPLLPTPLTGTGMDITAVSHSVHNHAKSSARSTNNVSAKSTPQ